MKGKNKRATSISIDPETRERLLQMADEKHSTISQIVTDWIWSIKLPSELKAEEAIIKQM